MSQGDGNYRGGPLTGMRVLELGSTVAAPFCGRLLADFGADVIKVEEAAGDPVRSMGKRLDGRSLYAASIFRNKRLISIDLRRPAGQALIRKLARDSDILIENFRPGTLERWSLGYASLAAENPALVMVRISGFGQTGPYAQRPGYGVVAEAIGGLRHLTGDPDRPPSRVATSLTDYLCGLHAAFGALMAVLVARETGRGQEVDASLLESAFAVTEPHIPAYDKLGHVAMRAGSRLPDNVPNALFECADGEFVHIATVGEPTFKRLAAAMGMPSLVEDSRFRTAAARAHNQAALEAAISAWTRARPLSQVEAILQQHDVPATRIYTMADIFRDPHFAARGAIVAAPDAALGSIKMANVFPCLSATPGQVRHAGSGTVGVDTRAVLRERAALSDADIDALEKSGIVVCGD